MRTIIISDIHLHQWPYGEPDRRLSDTARALGRALKQAAQEEADLVAITGDLFHTSGRVATPVLEVAYSIFKRFSGLPLVFVPGNHDETHRGQEQNALCFLEQFGPVATFEAPTIRLPHSSLPPIRVLPYTEEEDRIKRFLDETPTGAIVLMHQGVKNVEMNAKGFVLNEGIDPAWVPTDILGLFTGHYHSFRRFTATGTIPGALVQHNFGDAGDPRGFLVVEGEKDAVVRQVPVESLQFVDVDYEDSIAFTCDEAEKRAAGHFLRVKDIPPKLVSEVQAEIRKRSAWAADPILLPASVTHVEKEARVDMENSIQALFEQYVSAHELTKDEIAAGRDIVQAAF